MRLVLRDNNLNSPLPVEWGYTSVSQLGSSSSSFSSSPDQILG